MLHNTRLLMPFSSKHSSSILVKQCVFRVLLQREVSHVVYIHPNPSECTALSLIAHAGLMYLQHATLDLRTHRVVTELQLMHFKSTQLHSGPRRLIYFLVWHYHIIVFLQINCYYFIIKETVQIIVVAR